MNRRNFVSKSALLSTSVLMAGGHLPIRKSPKYKLGYQLYSVNADMNENPMGTLNALKKMGYQDFETFGFNPENATYYSYPAADFKKMLDDMELSVTSGHYTFSDYFMASDSEIKHFVDQCIKGAKILHKPYITWPFLAEEYRTIDNFKILAEKLNTIGEQINAAGLGFAYHNHGFEFEDHDGENGYDIILNDTDPELVKIELDMYWVMHAGTTTPKEIVAKHPGRVVMWHLKDMDKVTRDYTELGNGSIDYTSIMPDPEKSGLEFYYIEQGGNFTHSAIESAEASARYLKRHLLEFL